MKRTSLLIAIAATAVALLMALPGNVPAVGSSSLATAGTALKGQADPTQSVNYILSPTSFNLSSIFWGTTVSPRSRILPGEGTLINATRDTTVVWPGGAAGDDYDPLPGELPRCAESSPNSSGGCIYNGKGVGTKPVTTEADFVSWCESISCTAIMQVPVEPDNMSLIEGVVAYTEKVLDFHPAYWELGNEPELWLNFGANPWQYGQHVCSPCSVNPTTYGSLVRNATLEILSVDPDAKVIGLAATGRPNGHGPIDLWIEKTVQDGVYVDNLSTGAPMPGIVGVAYHSYPAGGQTPGGLQALQNFYGAINGSAGITSRYAEAHRGVLYGMQNLTNASTACKAAWEACTSNVAVFITEVGSALSHYNSFHLYSANFPGALDIAAQMTQAMQANVVNQDLFGSVGNLSNSWFSQQGLVRPSYTLYSQILSHLGNQVYDVTLRTPPSCDCIKSNLTLGSDLYGIATRAPSYYNRTDLMVVNLNNTTGVTFTPELPGISTPASAEVWLWSAANPGDPIDPATANPVPTSFTLGPSSVFTLPASSVALIEAYPQGGVPVNVTSTGLNVLEGGVLPRWYVDTNGFYWEANATAILTMFLPAGQYSVSSPSISLNHSSALSFYNTERYPKQRLEPLLSPTWDISLASAAFEITWEMQWLTNISANPAGGGYVTPAPQWWDNNTPLLLTETPAFHYAFEFWQGYGNGSYSNTTPNATIQPTDWIAEKAIFVWAYSVTFTESGLPAGTSWSVTSHARFNDSGTATEINSTATSRTSALSLSEPNGSYGYTIDNVPGYRSRLNSTGALENSSFNVSGGDLRIAIIYSPIGGPAPQYAVNFQEVGLPVGTPWYVRTLFVDNNTTLSDGGTVSSYNRTYASDASTLPITEVNGSFTYEVSAAPGFIAYSRDDAFTVDGAPTNVTITFHPFTYYVTWEESGLGPNLTWSVVVDGSPVVSSGSWTRTQLPNGTYAYSIPQVEDFIPQDRAGEVTVNGQNVTVPFSFPEVNFTVDFVLAGAPTGMVVEVRLSHTTTNAVVGAAGTNAVFYLSNGSYTFDVMPPNGYLASPSHGTITVHAGSVTVDVSIVSAGPPPPPPIWDLALPALIAAAAIAMAGIGTLLLSRRRKRGRPGELP